MKIEELARKEVSNLSLYQVDSLSQSPLEKVTKLDLNENLMIEKDVIQKILLNAAKSVDLRLYPPVYSDMATKAISDFFKVDKNKVFVGNGADGVLDSLMKVFVDTGSKVLVVEPTFSMYDYFIKLYGGKKVTALLTSRFELDVDAVRKKCDEKTSMIFICSPNNPTGNQFQREKLEAILRDFNGIVVVDEAYADFANYTVVDWIKKFDNLVAVRTFSKSFGLAGIRSGFLISNEEIVDYVKRVTPPFAVNAVTQRVIDLALKNWDYFQQRIQLIIKERKWLRDALNDLAGIIPYPSDTNFLLLRVVDHELSSSTLKERLKNEGVLVKDRGSLPLLENCIRITVGTRNMNKTLISALNKILEN